MKTTKAILMTAVLALFAAPTLWAQAPREEVKKEAAAANKAGTITTGEAEAPKAVKPGPSTTTRTAVKAEAAKANKAGQISCGEGAPGKADDPKSTKSRADVKAEAAKANKAGEIPCGEAAAGPTQAVKK